MSIKIIQKPISKTLKQLLENNKLTEQQKKIWETYLFFLNEEQVNDLCEIMEKDKESFNSLMTELELVASK